MSHDQIGISEIRDKIDNRIYSQFVDLMKVEAVDPSKRFTIAVVLICPDDESRFLAVKRPGPAYDEIMPNVWGLPAITLNNTEIPEIATSRLGKEKLNTDIQFIGSIGLDISNRGNYQLILMDVVAELIGGEPSVIDAITEHTKYTNQVWTNDLFLLKEAASKGSLCSRILLRSFNISF
jgi:hypothetical protein